ncbi:papain-like cysteine protease family protein [Allorhizocola rhizosphaerae]|uniref:papain-like cysteine protease family protein n=1 Tax=Allorhizocola rhizosphaerae TaxID=1872709 RepID=UPI001B8B6341|nr:papain-like cysteine protease family protein [Allorhizocola rhizosphaerae]
MSEADLRNLGDTPITFESTAYPEVFLRMDGTGVNSQTSSGGGKVNCNFRPADKEKFKLRSQADGTFSIESIAFPNVFLRVDGSGVTSQTTNGGGTANCQFNANGGIYEKFRLRPQADGSYSVESAAFPNVFLRMVGTGVTSYTAQGGGLVNCQFNANGGSDEKFKLHMADQSLNFANAEIQQRNMWCWAASSINIEKFYNPASAWTQCTLVNDQFGLNNCCGDAGGVAPCNNGNWPTGSLRRMNHLREELFRALTPVEVAAELAKSQPIGVDTHWERGGGHIVVIRGRWESGGTEWLRIHDPWDGFVDVTFNVFRDNYTASRGVWSRSYTTARQAQGA